MAGTTELRNGFSHAQLAEAISPRVQELILLPTEKCNFRCTYCYEDFAQGKMTESTQRAIERFIERRVSRLSTLRFSWFGGEPLIAKDVVIRLSSFAKTICEENGTRFLGSLTTNAYLLTRELAIQLIDLNQNFFQITLDGFGDLHDELRRRADGGPTFRRIWENLLDLKQINRQFEVVIRIHVRPSNLENLQILMKQLSREFLGDPRFVLDFQHLRDMGGEGGKTITEKITLEQLPDIERRLRNIFANPEHEASAPNTPRFRSQMPTLAPNSGESAGAQRPSERVNGQPYICYATKPNSLLIRSNGRIGKCTVALYDERNDLRKLNEDGTVALDNQLLQPWIRGLGTLDPDDVGCPIKRMNSNRDFKGVEIKAIA